MKTILLGFDSFDPAVFEDMAGKNQLPNLSKFADAKGYSRFEVCSPPQTEVSWTSIATGADPGSHGIFDFVHRDPSTYAPYVSILPTKKTVAGEQFVPPYIAKTLFEEAAEMGYPATALWWPAMYPARPELPINTLPGLGAPDIRGQLGVGTLFTTEDEKKNKTTVTRFESTSKGIFKAMLNGPSISSKNGPQPVTLPVVVDVIDANSAKITIGDQQFQLRVGEWSDIVEIKFKAGFLFNVHAITRVILTSLNGAVRLYSLPLQIHPLHALSHYSSSKSFAKNLWQKVGAYLTLGWPQDTTGLEDGCISDAQFITLCDTIFERRKQIFFHLLGEFKEGVLASIFDDLDRVQHMFYHNQLDVAQAWYKKLDGFVGEVNQRVEHWGGKYNYLVMSDHGFTTYEHKIHLNRWLAQNGYLALQDGKSEGDLSSVDWSRTKAYAVGLNSVYLNVAGREGQGIVGANEIEPLLTDIQTRLMDWKGADGNSVAHRIRLKHETYNGAYTRFGPDLVVGYARGYRASSETGLGKIPQALEEPNHDHWGADHCVDTELVQGVIFTNRDLQNFGGVSFRDVPFLAIGKHLDQSHIKPPSQQTGGHNQKDLEERLKGLGYL
ncbi:MAG: alkaline phosphatase family protein [Anaerolineales bacterium]|nr:alkaline phosphatase family protein [Anaerolineales bacterium]